jgi:hypothetical protein
MTPGNKMEPALRANFGILFNTMVNSGFRVTFKDYPDFDPSKEHLTLNLLNWYRSELPRNRRRSLRRSRPLVLRDRFQPGFPSRTIQLILEQEEKESATCVTTSEQAFDRLQAFFQPKLQRRIGEPGIPDQVKGNALSYTDYNIQMSSSSGTPESWISSFCSLLGHEYFAEISEDFIEDDFNLTGLQTQVAMYKEALEVRSSARHSCKHH